MSATDEDTKPVVDIPFEDAIQELTGFEVLAIAKHFGMDFERIGGVRTLLGAVWAYESRGATTAWSHVESMTLKQLQSYFAKEDSDPTDEAGKD